MDEAKAISYVCVDSNGLASLVITDDDYPGKVAFIIINEMFKEFYGQFPDFKLETIASNYKKTKNGW